MINSGNGLNSRPKAALSKINFWSLLQTIQKDLGHPVTFIPRSKLSGLQPKIVRRHRPDYFILLFMILLMLVGLVMTFALSPQISNVRGNADQYVFFTKQVVSVFLSLVVFFLFYKIFNFEWWQKKAFRWLLVVGCGFSLLLFLLSQVKPDLVCGYGACRWLPLGFGFSLQVSEIVKFCWLLFFSVFWAYLIKQNTLEQKSNLKKSLVIILIGLLQVVVLQKDLGTGVSMAVFLLAMALMTGVKFKKWLLLVGVLLTGGVAAMLLQPYRVSRVLTFWGASNNDHHISEAKIALGSGGMFGVGLGNSVQSAGYLPEVTNDSIFAIIGEIFGFVGTTLVILLFCGLLFRLYKGIVFAHKATHRLFLTGVFAWIAAHLLINVSSMTGLLPMTGITLPFISSGGTSMLFVAAILGISFALSAYSAHTPFYNNGAIK